MNQKDIPFDTIMRDYKNWDEDVDVENMDSNYKLLKPIIDKFYFRDMPTNPKLFSLVFSKSEFADSLIVGLKLNKVKELSKVYFCEYLKEDKEKLISLGVISSLYINDHVVVYTASEDLFFVNVLI